MVRRTNQLVVIPSETCKYIHTYIHIYIYILQKSAIRGGHIAYPAVLNSSLLTSLAGISPFDCGCCLGT